MKYIALTMVIAALTGCASTSNLNWHADQHEFKQQESAQHVTQTPPPGAWPVYATGK